MELNRDRGFISEPYDCHWNPRVGSLRNDKVKINEKNKCASYRVSVDFFGVAGCCINPEAAFLACVVKAT